ncbi:NlpC/P60 family protein [Arthrobacter sp. D1-17]
MSSRTTPARRAAAGRSNPFASASRAVTANAGGLGRKAAVVLAASGLAFTGTMAANAANAPAQKAAAPALAPEAASPAQAPLNASSSVSIAYERPAVKSAPAPVVEEPVIVEKPAVPAAPKVAAAKAPAAAPVAPPAPVAAHAPAAQAPAAAPAPKITVKSAPAPAPAAAGSVNASMVSAAYAQIGITQDCTAMVEKALGASGIKVGDLAPMQFMNYGKVVSTPQPGDMIVQSGHVAIFVGNGQALSGGMNGVNETIVHPLSWLNATGPVTFVRPAA